MCIRSNQHCIDIPSTTPLHSYGQHLVSIPSTFHLRPIGYRMLMGWSIQSVQPRLTCHTPDQSQPLYNLFNLSYFVASFYFVYSCLLLLFVFRHLRSSLPTSSPPATDLSVHCSSSLLLFGQLLLLLRPSDHSSWSVPSMSSVSSMSLAVSAGVARDSTARELSQKVFMLNLDPGGVMTIIFVTGIRLELANSTVVADAWILPLIPLFVEVFARELDQLRRSRGTVLECTIDSYLLCPEKMSPVFCPRYFRLLSSPPRTNWWPH